MNQGKMERPSGTIKFGLSWDHHIRRFLESAGGFLVPEGRPILAHRFNGGTTGYTKDMPSRRDVR